MEHQLAAEVINRHGTVLATLENTFRVSDAARPVPSRGAAGPARAVDHRRALAPGAPTRCASTSTTSRSRRSPLYVVPATVRARPVRASPTQSRVADDEGTVGGAPTSPRPEAAPGSAPNARAGGPAPSRGGRAATGDGHTSCSRTTRWSTSTPRWCSTTRCPPRPPSLRPPRAGSGVSIPAAPVPAFDLPPAPPAPDEAVDWGGDRSSSAAGPGPRRRRSRTREQVRGYRAPDHRAAPAAEPRVYDFDEDDPASTPTRAGPRAAIRSGRPRPRLVPLRTLDDEADGWLAPAVSPETSNETSGDLVLHDLRHDEWRPGAADGEQHHAVGGEAIGLADVLALKHGAWKPAISSSRASP